MKDSRSDVPKVLNEESAASENWSLAKASRLVAEHTDSLREQVSRPDSFLLPTLHDSCVSLLVDSDAPIVSKQTKVSDG